MSIIFGIRKATGNPATEQEMQRLASTTRSFAPDGTFVTVQGHLGMGFQPFHTTRLSHKEFQPAIDPYKNLLIFDGRLDNRSELLAALNIQDVETNDSTLVLAAFERWGENVFARLIGDWALALWCGATQTLFLGCDHAGTRTLYFQNANGIVLWSTYLETFFADGGQPPLDEEYVAAFLCNAPIRDLTPYRGIRAVPPAHYLAIQGERITKVRHWHSVADSEIRYKTDTEYEEHFFALFRQAVERRAAVGDPILAQLSGGMDSTSIVCMSDHIRASQGYSTANLLDTISYLSPSEPNWNEEPFIAATEAQRGKVGVHLETSYSERMFEPPPPESGRHLFPGITASSIDFHERFHASLDGRDYRVILSGIGGDEVLGGVPTPGPELADYLTRLGLRSLFKQGLAWSLASRNPMLHLMLGAAHFAFGLYWPHTRLRSSAPAWLAPRLRNLRIDNSDAGLTLVPLLRAKPSVLSNARAWSSILETLPSRRPAAGPCYEYRYPYLDRDLVDFLFRIPHDQITRPGRRRSLMRRALRELLPIEVLERRRKAYLSRGPLVAFQEARETTTALLADSRLAELNFVNVASLRLSLNAVASGTGTNQWPGLIKALALELWLQSEPWVIHSNRSGHRERLSLFKTLEHPSSVQIGP